MPPRDDGKKNKFVTERLLYPSPWQELSAAEPPGAPAAKILDPDGNPAVTPPVSKTCSTHPAPFNFSRAWSVIGALTLLLVGLVAATSAQAAAGSAAGWKAGTGRAKITPPAGLWMTGYATRDRPADGTAQELWVKALAVSDPMGNRGVLLTADLCGITRQISDDVAAELERQHGIPRSAVMTNVSHTHCSPWLDGNLNGLRLLPPDGVEKARRYTLELKANMIRAASAALRSLEPAVLTWGEDAAHFSFNRRENAEKDAPALRAAGKLKGPLDPRVPVLAVRNAKGDLHALLVSFACHATTLAFFQWHGDYPGSAQVELERRHPTATVLFAAGCGADMNPAPRREVAMADQHGRDLADAADRALAKPMQTVTGKFGSAFSDITLKFASKPTEAQLREAREKDQPNKEMHQAWSATVTEQLRLKGDAILQYSYPIQAWTLGGLTWVALGGEVVIDYSFRLRKELAGESWIFGYSTDVMAYIPSERVLKEGRYEGATSMIPYGQPGPWAPGLEDKIVNQARTMVMQARGK